MILRGISLPSLILVFAFATGCSSPGTTTYPVTGTVTFDGQPVPDGDIIFTSATDSSGGKIQNGKYTANVAEGKKRVEIRASRMTKLPAGQTGAMGETEMLQDYIPAKYNSESTLEYEVSSSGPNTKDYTLESK